MIQVAVSFGCWPTSILKIPPLLFVRKKKFTLNIVKY